MEFTAEIPTKNLTSVLKAFKAVEKKAATLNVPAPTIACSDLISRKLQDGSYRKFHNVTVRGELPKISGWRLVARIDHTQERNIIVGINKDDEEINAKWRDAESDCDHCEQQRNRNDTFILVNDDGGWKQVGRNCLSDFAGSTDPARWLVMFVSFTQSVRNLEDDEQDGYGHANPYIDTEIYLTHVSALIDEHGWYSRTAWKDNGHTGVCTADRALNNMFPHNPQYAIETTEDNAAEAQKAIGWARGLNDKDKLNEYEYNLMAVTDGDCFNAMRYAGLVASTIMAYRRDSGLDERGEKEEIVSVHQGDLKERLDLTLTISKRIDMEVDSYGGYGYDMLRIHIMNDAEGNIYIWKTTSEHLEEGWTYQMRGTVKDHTEYRGTPQTVLTRCKVSEHVSAEDECECWHCKQLDAA